MKKGLKFCLLLAFLLISIVCVYPKTVSAEAKKIAEKSSELTWWGYEDYVRFSLDKKTSIKIDFISNYKVNVYVLKYEENDYYYYYDYKEIYKYYGGNLQKYLELDAGDYKISIDYNVDIYDENTYNYNLVVYDASNIATGIELKNVTKDIYDTQKINIDYTLKPNDSIAKSIDWTTNDSKICKVSNRGEVTAKKAGTCKVTATLDNGSKSTIKFKIKNHTIKLKSKSKTMTIGKVKSIGYTISPKNYTGKVEWSSSNKKIAKVSKKGEITPKSLGTCKITAKLSNGKKATATINVTKTKKVQAIKGHTKNLKNYVKNIKNYKKGTWSTSNSKVATVNANGQITGVSTGSCNIYFTVSGKKYTIPVKVVQLVTATAVKVKDVAIYNDAYVKITNNSSKTITHVDLNIYQYDNRGYSLKSPYSSYYSDETINPNSYDIYYWWVNNDTKSIKPVIKKVWFSDGSTWRP